MAVRSIFGRAAACGVPFSAARPSARAHPPPSACPPPSAWAAAGRGRRAAAPLTPRRLAAALAGRLPLPGARIGLLGGSFNPAHGGHRHISLAALRRLGLDEVWWLVSPQNPLKPRAGMAPFAARRESARRVIAGHPRLRATALEDALGTAFTADTLALLTRRFPAVRFVWLMGADNLAQIDRWERWTALFATLPIAVFDRPSYSYSTISAKAARRFASARVPEAKARTLAARSPPAWVFLHQPRDRRSATHIRQRTPNAQAPTGNWPESEAGD